MTINENFIKDAYDFIDKRAEEDESDEFIPLRIILSNLKNDMERLKSIKKLLEENYYATTADISIILIEDFVSLLNYCLKFVNDCKDNKKQIINKDILKATFNNRINNYSLDRLKEISNMLN